MRIWILVLLFAVLLGGIVFLFWPKANLAATVTNYPSQGTDIVAFGDSLIDGYGSSENKDFVSDLSRAINQPIVNLGVDGDTTAGALARIHDIDKYHPKVVIVLVGGNDYLQRKDMTEAFKNLGQIIEYMQSRGAVVLLVGVRINYFVGNFDSQYEALVKQYKVAYVPDALDGIIGNKQYMFDQVHPNDTGYQMLSDRVLPTLQELLK